MRYLPWLCLMLTGVAFASLLSVGALTVAQVSADEADGRMSESDILVALSVSEVSVPIGETFTFTSEMVNRGSQVTPPLIANLNITSLDQSTYIDPEDWSPQRTLAVAPIEPGSSAVQSWKVNAILRGDVAVYVVVLPESPALATADPLFASPAIRVLVEAQRTLNPGGVLPVVVVVPGLLTAALAGLMVARRRSS